MNPPSSTMIRGGLGLTKRQADLLRFIEAYLADTGGISPSLEEMRVHLELDHKGSIHSLLCGLEERGRIRRIRNRARAIEVLRPAEPMLRSPTPPRICWIPLRGIINLNEHPVRP